MGEKATCVMCGKQIAVAALLDPDGVSDWRMFVWGERTMYACPEEFPPDDAGEEAFRDAYLRVLQRLCDVSGKQSGIDE